MRSSRGILLTSACKVSWLWLHWFVTNRRAAAHTESATDAAEAAEAVATDAAPAPRRTREPREAPTSGAGEEETPVEEAPDTSVSYDEYLKTVKREGEAFEARAPAKIDPAAFKGVSIKLGKGEIEVPGILDFDGKRKVSTRGTREAARDDVVEDFDATKLSFVVADDAAPRGGGRGGFRGGRGRGGGEGGRGRGGFRGDREDRPPRPRYSDRAEGDASAATAPATEGTAPTAEGAAPIEGETDGFRRAGAPRGEYRGRGRGGESRGRGDGRGRGRGEGRGRSEGGRGRGEGGRGRGGEGGRGRGGESRGRGGESRGRGGSRGGGSAGPAAPAASAPRAAAPRGPAEFPGLGALA